LPPAGRGRFTFGLGRAEILSARANGRDAARLGAGHRGRGDQAPVVGPAEVDGGFVLVVGLVGACANVGAAAALGKPSALAHVGGRPLHVLTDLFASLAAADRRRVVCSRGFRPAPTQSRRCSWRRCMLRSGWRLLRDSGRVLLEGAPEGIDPQAIGRALAAYPGVVEVHDLTSGRSPRLPGAGRARARQPGDDCHGRAALAAGHGRRALRIEHVTLQVDHAPPATACSRSSHGGSRMQFGLSMFVTDETIAPSSSGRAAEDAGFDAIFVPSTRTSPASRESAWPAATSCRASTRTRSTPFVALSAIAATTERLRVGTGIAADRRARPDHPRPRGRLARPSLGGRFELGHRCRAGTSRRCATTAPIRRGASRHARARLGDARDLDAR
jgi:Co/Zn/Cd efflux system component